MSTAFKILAVIVMVAVAAVLVRGLVNMMKGATA